MSSNIDDGLHADRSVLRATVAILKLYVPIQRSQEILDIIVTRRLPEGACEINSDHMPSILYIAIHRIMNNMNYGYLYMWF